MDTESLIQLTNNLYNLTLLFPKKEPLRYKMRETALELLADFVYSQRGCLFIKAQDLTSRIRGELEVLESFFNIVKNQNWVKTELVLAIENEYGKIKRAIERPPAEILSSAVAGEKTGAKAPFSARKEIEAAIEEEERIILEPERNVPPPLARELAEKTAGLDSRQLKVLRILQEKKEIQIGELSKYFPQFSRRTILRDLDKLAEMKLVVREGDGRGVFYRFQLKQPSQ